jgi:hypothetical protein
MPKANGPRKIHRYATEFKVKAVKSTHLPRVRVKAVADPWWKTERPARTGKSFFFTLVVFYLERPYEPCLVNRAGFSRFAGFIRN